MSKRKLLEEAEVLNKRKHKIDLDAPTDDEENYDDGANEEEYDQEQETPVQKKSPKDNKKKKAKKNKQKKVEQQDAPAPDVQNVQKEVNLFIKKLKVT
jgi:hypothetical protein